MLSAIAATLCAPYQTARIQGTSAPAIEALSFDASTVLSSLQHL